MRRILCGLLGATIAVACSASPETKSVDTTAALGASPAVDTPAVGAMAATRDSSRAEMIAARRSVTRPAVVYHGTEDQKALSELRLQKPKTTYRRLEPVKRPTNR